MRKIALIALAAVGLSACEKSISEPEGPMSGTWHYTSADLVLGPLIPVPQHCAVDAYLELTQVGNTIEGVSRDSKWTCHDPATGHTWVQEEIETQVYGEVQDGRVLVSFGNGWQSYGELHPQRIEGYVEQYNGILPGEPAPVRIGEFVLTRE
jgi:hypothetical protein